MVVGCIGTLFHDSGSLGDRLAMIFSAGETIFDHNSGIKRVKEVLTPSPGVWRELSEDTQHTGHTGNRIMDDLSQPGGLSQGRASGCWEAVGVYGDDGYFIRPLGETKKGERLRTEGVWDFGGSEAGG